METPVKTPVLGLFKTYLLPLVPNQQKRREEHAFLLRFRWKRCWKNRLRLQWSCRSAFGHQAEFHAPSNTIPNKHCQSALRPVQRELRCTHAKKETENELENRFKVTREWRCLLTVPRAQLSRWRRVGEFYGKNRPSYKSKASQAVNKTERKEKTEQGTRTETSRG